ncbi:MAG: hypothetical protein LBV74_10565 [Tannerella sp.]|nr:hypothetical protein [Tannerella sp.]
MSKAAKASIAYTFASFFTQGLNIITTPIFTRLLSIEDYGIITTYNSWNSIIGVLAMLALTSGVFNIGMLEFKNDRNNFIFSLLVLSNIATIVLACIYVIFQSFFNDLFQIPQSLILLMFLGFLLNPAKNF